VPHRRAAERDEEAIATWVKETWPSVERPRGIRTGGSASPVGTLSGQDQLSGSGSGHDVVADLFFLA
jgi:hypothetical protein